MPERISIQLPVADPIVPRQPTPTQEQLQADLIALAVLYAEQGQSQKALDHYQKIQQAT